LDEVVGRAHGAGAAWTVQRWLAHWLSTNPRIRPATRSSYEAHVRVHLGPTLGRYRLDELTPPIVQAAFTRIAATRTRTGQPLSPATVRRIHATLRAALNAALRDGLIATNPAWHTRLPLAQPVRPEVWTPGRVAIWQATGERPTVAVWTPDQLAAFLHHSLQAQDPLYPAWRLIALRGLRRGEACGLRWADLDLGPADDHATGGTTARGHGRLRVVQAIVQIGGHVSPAPPKTPASRRTISLDPMTTTLLRDLRTAAAARAGGRLDPTSPVLADQAGRPLQPQRLSVVFRRAVQASGLTRSGCTTCATARPASPSPPAQTSRPSKTSSDTPPSSPPPTSTPPCCPRCTTATPTPSPTSSPLPSSGIPTLSTERRAVTASWWQGTPASHLRHTHVTPGLPDRVTTP
jgi:integrase